MTLRATFYKIAYPVAKIWWFIRRPKVNGAGCVISCGDKLLLIRNTYGGRTWSFPGGGIKKNEDPGKAAMREVREEVGIALAGIKSLGTFLHTLHYRQGTVNVFTSGTDSKNIEIDKGEILEAGWFAPEEISKLELSSIGKRMLQMYNEHKQ